MSSDAERLRKGKLAPALGISRVTLDAYLNRSEPPPPLPDGDLMYSLEEVANYIASIKSAPDRKGEAYYKAEKVRLQCEEIAFKLQVARGKFISRDECLRTIAPLMAELDELLEKKYVLELPSRYKGHDMIECQEMNRNAKDEIARRFRNGMKPITEEKAA